MKALTAAEMRQVERVITERYGISTSQLMESAGQSVNENIRNHFRSNHMDRPYRVAVLCGKGNNGGDGFVAPRHLPKETPRFYVRGYFFAPAQGLRGGRADEW